MRFICLFIGHNKILEAKLENGNSTFFDVCSQCHKSWFNKELNVLPKTKTVKEPMNILVKPNLQKISQKQLLIQKAKANFYVL
jgi:transcription elongation factor Elf1